VVGAFVAAGVDAGVLAGVLGADDVDEESPFELDEPEDDVESELVVLAGALESDFDLLESRESLR
jgi:hypothetical protein